MTQCSELIVLLPCHDLDDLVGTAKESATSILNAWTAAWHPAFLAHFQRIPAWFASDAPPEPEVFRAALIPESCRNRLNGGWIARLDSESGKTQSDVVSVDDHPNRTAFVRKLLGAEPRGDSWANDFFALGFVVLEIQLMTRKLRYSSNLDQAFLGQRAIAAAVAAVANDAEAARSALQECFDLVAQERDHFFSGDPYLVDLTLVSPTNPTSGLDYALSTSDPINLLISADLLQQLSKQAPLLLAQLQQRLHGGSAEVVGGWDDTAPDFQRLTANEVTQWLDLAQKTYDRLLGRPVRVFARLGGGVPADLVGPLVERGYRGAIVADFLGGKDSGQSEPKLVWQLGSHRLDAITARPLDASRDSETIDVGPRLGESLDAGHVATALLTHWPQQDGNALQDLRTAARWGLALGKFVTASQYFEQSARSYHHFRPAEPRSQATWLQYVSSDPTAQPLAVARQQFIDSVSAETRHVTEALLRWAIPSTPAADSQPTRSDRALISPHVAAIRTTNTLGFWPVHERKRMVLGAVDTKDQGVVSRIEVPGCGFAAPKQGHAPRFTWWRPRPKLVEQPWTLNNGLMHVHLDPQRGSVRAVYLPGSRANLFSLRLLAFDADAPQPDGKMEADSIRVRHADSVRGEIEVTGRCLRGKDLLAKFKLLYRVQLGSRLLEVEGTVEPMFEAHEDPWRRYLGLRAVVANSLASPEIMVRDRRIAAMGRRYVAPLGLHLDLASSSVTICSGGSSVHRRFADDRFDTLLAIGPGSSHFRIAYGFNLAQPIHAARAWIAPPQLVSAPLVGNGYFLHVSPPSIVLLKAEIDDQNRSIDLTLLDSEGRGRNVKVRSCRPLAEAYQLLDGDSQPRALEISDDSASLTIAPHSQSKLRLVAKETSR